MTPMKLPREYRGFQLTKFQGTQVGHPTEGGGLRSRLGLGTHRKVKGVSSIDPEGYERIHDTVKAAVSFIDQWYGTE